MPVLALFILLAAGVAAAAATHPGDDVAMRSLANTTGTAKTLQWGASSPDPCGGTWVGVTCNAEGRVTAINASRGGLTGHLVGADLSTLASLSDLDLSFNALRDDLPVLPQPLGGLRALDLRSNSFFAITDGFFAAFPALQPRRQRDVDLETWIPSDVTSCPGLRSFSAVDVHFAGGFPNYFGNATLFPELESLSLARNLLWGEIAPEFGKNSKIRFLDVSQQGHDEDARGGGGEGLSFVSGMANLVEAHLQRNVFKGPLPDATSLANLRVFDASDNDLCGVAKFPAGVTVNVAGNPGVAPAPPPPLSLHHPRSFTRTAACNFDYNIACSARLLVVPLQRSSASVSNSCRSVVMIMFAYCRSSTALPTVPGGISTLEELPLQSKPSGDMCHGCCQRERMIEHELLLISMRSGMSRRWMGPDNTIVRESSPRWRALAQLTRAAPSVSERDAKLHSRDSSCSSIVRVRVREHSCFYCSTEGTESERG
ncbi:hypothetical protein DAI22_10g112502 [Oryza sativa Japonica Group]|nr:hypothetical protein DAI22_10g112502 [Oryza sativa Japonica Group]